MTQRHPPATHYRLTQLGVATQRGGRAGRANAEFARHYVFHRYAVARSGKSSAIWTALSAAPFKSWSAATNIEIECPLGSLRSLRMRPTSTASWPVASIGIGKWFWAR